MALTALAREILAAIPDGGPQRDHAVIVWTDERDGSIQMGPCRYRREIKGGTYYDCSPFPGAWNPFVTEDQIIAVRHTLEMKINAPEPELATWPAQPANA